MACPSFPPKISKAPPWRFSPTAPSPVLLFYYFANDTSVPGGPGGGPGATPRPGTTCCAAPGLSPSPGPSPKPDGSSVQTIGSLSLSHHLSARGGRTPSRARVVPSSPKPWPSLKLIGVERGGREEISGLRRVRAWKGAVIPRGSPPTPRASPRRAFGDAASPAPRSCASRRPSVRAAAGRRRWWPGRVAGPRAPIHKAPLGGGGTRRRGGLIGLIGVWA